MISNDLAAAVGLRSRRARLYRFAIIASPAHPAKELPAVHADPGSGLIWSHEALHAATFYSPLHEPDDQTLYKPVAALNAAKAAREQGSLRTAERLEARAQAQLAQLDDRTQTKRPMIRERDGGYCSLPALRLPMIAFWLYAIPAALTEEQLDQLLTAEASRRCREVLDAVLDRDHASRQQGEGERLLAEALGEGLQLHHGRHLVGSEPQLYFHLVARGIRNSKHRLCERCQLVHRSHRARMCPACRHSPPRPHLHQHHREAITPKPRSEQRIEAIANGTSIVLATRHDRRPPALLYLGVCACHCGCRREFRSSRADRRHCAQCSTPAARIARSRGLACPTSPPAPRAPATGE